jgi:hypothetical protein
LYYSVYSQKGKEEKAIKVFEVRDIRLEPKEHHKEEVNRKDACARRNIGM